MVLCRVVKCRAKLGGRWVRGDSVGWIPASIYTSLFRVVICLTLSGIVRIALFVALWVDFAGKLNALDRYTSSIAKATVKNAPGQQIPSISISAAGHGQRSHYRVEVDCTENKRPM